MASPLRAQARTRRPATAARIAPRFYLVSEPHHNLVVYLDDSLTFVAGSQTPALVTRAHQLLRELKAPPVRYVLIMEDDSAAYNKDGGWASHGATTIAPEMLYVRMRSGTPASRGEARLRANRLPIVGFSRVLQLFLTSEEAHMVHDYSGSSDADVIVHFEEAGVLMLGAIFSSDGYPRIDVKNGGSIAGELKWLEWFTTMFDRAKVEPIVPGRGPVATLEDLKDYRSMLTSIRDRVAALHAQGASVEQVIAARPTAEFDGRWGRGAVSPDELVRAIYESLSKR